MQEAIREGFKKKMVGFIQRSSDPSQPGRALDKKNPQFFYVWGKVEVKKSD